MTYHRNDTTADILHQHPDPDAGPIRCRDYCGAIHRRQRNASLAAWLARDNRAASGGGWPDGPYPSYYAAEAIRRQRQSADAYAQARAMYEESR